MVYNDRGHTSTGSIALGPEECPLLTLKLFGHTSTGSMALGSEECPLLTLKLFGHTSTGSMALESEECPRTSYWTNFLYRSDYGE